MTRPRPWTVLSRRVVQDGRVFRVQALDSEREGGTRATFYAIDSVDWTNVIALTPARDVVMIRQFRHGLGAEVLEIPGGMVDPGEDPARCAERELLEETGYRAKRWSLLGAVNPNPALFGNRLHTYLAEDCEPVAAIANDELESTVVELVPLSEIPARIGRGEVDHALVLSAFQFLALRER